MLYPKLFNIKKNHFVIKLLMGISILIAIICFLINLLVENRFYWSIISIFGIVYIWVTTMYSIKKNVNIASHVAVQMICTSILVVIIDLVIGFSGWSINFAIPIITMTANTTIFILTIVSRKKYLKYVIYELIIFLFSMLPLLLVLFKMIDKILFVCISTGIAILNLLFVICLCGKDVKEEVKRRFHL